MSLRALVTLISLGVAIVGGLLAAGFPQLVLPVAVVTCTCIIVFIVSVLVSTRIYAGKR